MFDRVRSTIQGYIQRDDLEITLDTDVLSDLGINSLELVELVCAFEMEFDREIPEKDIRQFVTVEDIVRYLEAIEA